MATLSLRQIRVEISGLVQGVGFRPFLFRLASQYRQLGWVANSSSGVIMALQGERQAQDDLLAALQNQLPPFAEIDQLSWQEQPLAHFTDFRIIASEQDGQASAFVLPDIASCPACLHDVDNPDSRFFRYPFTSCSYCGPRYSIMRSQPYDRESTSMAPFVRCPACEQDYRAVNNRRFHAQTIACEHCGPTLQLCDSTKQLLATGDDALHSAIEHLRQGQIVAIKGIGGFQLLVDAGNQAAVSLLRVRKQRPDKPFALLVATLDQAARLCRIDGAAQSALTGPAAPIVLMPRLDSNELAESVAPDNAMLGVMLPASPLHHLLALDFAKPLVATSGNLHDEPLCIDNEQALNKLGAIADVFLIHDRDIVRPLDDSIVRIIAGKTTVLRRARGFAPLPLAINQPLPAALAVGGHLKNSVAVTVGQHIVCSQHLGDLDNADGQQQFEKTIDDLTRFYRVTPECVLHDRHPDYHSSQKAAAMRLPKQAVQHHYAHILSCMAEHDVRPPLLGFAWDGSGLGDDQAICGSECLLITEQGYRRMAHLRPIALPGGDQAAKQPRRSALAIVHAIYGNQLPDSPCLDAFSPSELSMLKQMLNKPTLCPPSTAAGRLFDAVASLLGLCQINRYEGQAAMLLEQAAATSVCDTHYPFQLSSTTPVQIDWQPMIENLLSDIGQVSLADIAAQFHNTLAEIMLQIAQTLGESRIVLSGGCFQNARLTETTIYKLQTAGFQVYHHQKIPPNDGGLAVGQLYRSGLTK